MGNHPFLSFSCDGIQPKQDSDNTYVICIPNYSKIYPPFKKNLSLKDKSLVIPSNDGGIFPLFIKGNKDFFGCESGQLFSEKIDLEPYDKDLQSSEVFVMPGHDEIGNIWVYVINQSNDEIRFSFGEPILKARLKGALNV